MVGTSKRHASAGASTSFRCDGSQESGVVFKDKGIVEIVVALVDDSFQEQNSGMVSALRRHSFA
jgi:hypothetical protein